MAEKQVVDEKRQLALFDSIVKELDSHGSLDDMILIGGWALRMYQRHYGNPRIPVKRTTDADFLFRNPPRVKNPFPVDTMLREKGFKLRMSPITDQYQYKHELLDIDFLMPHIGPADQASSKKIPGYGVEATRLRYLDLATEFTIQVDYNGSRLTVPHPAAYTYLKYIVGSLPSRSADKARKDIDTANRMSDFLASDEKQMQVLNSVMERSPDPWNKKFYGSVEVNNPPFLGKIRNFREEQVVTEFMVKNGIKHSSREELLLAEKSIVSLHLEKHREAIYRKTMEGLQPVHFAYFVNNYLIKGKGAVAVSEIVKSIRAKAKKTGREKGKDPVTKAFNDIAHEKWPKE